MESREAKTLEGIKLITLKKHVDERGFFAEAFTDRKFKEEGINNDFIQDNLAFSVRRGTLRGLHYQEGCHAQAKLVMVVNGMIKDVVVDLRKDSKTFGKWDIFLLNNCMDSRDHIRMLFVPPGFAHGYITLSDDTIVSYKVDGYYNKVSEKGIVWNDPTLKINWPTDRPIISPEDRKLPKFDPDKSYF